MKKIIVFLFGALLFTSCGVGSYTVASGKPDEASLSFTSTSAQPVTVYVDGTAYNLKTVKTKAYKTDRNIKKTALNTITVAPGQHDIKVVAGGNEVFGKKVYISTSEHRIINL